MIHVNLRYSFILSMPLKADMFFQTSVIESLDGICFYKQIEEKVIKSNSALVFHFETLWHWELFY